LGVGKDDIIEEDIGPEEVVGSEEYRILNVGEIILADDEVYYNLAWIKANSVYFCDIYTGKKSKGQMIRRKVNCNKESIAVILLNELREVYESDSDVIGKNVLDKLVDVMDKWGKL